VDASEQLTIFDSIYDHHELKTNHVRKWNSDLMRGIKSGNVEIFVEVVNDQSSEPVESYSIDKMKKTSTMELQKFCDVSGTVVNLLLRCQQTQSYQADEATPKVLPQHRTSASRSNDFDQSLSPMSSSVNRLRGSICDEWKNTMSNPMASEGSIESLQPSRDSDKISGTVRVSIENEKTGRSKNLLVTVDKNLNLFNAIYDHKDVKKANVRKWGAEIAKAVKSKTSEIRCLVWDESIQQPYHSFSIDELKTTSTKQLVEIAAEPTGVIKLVLRCYDKLAVNSSDAAPSEPETSSVRTARIRRSNSTSTVGSIVDDIASVKSKSLAELEVLVQEKRETRSAYSVGLDDSQHKKETMRVRVVNQISKRHKDLIVDVRDDLIVNDAIYNNKGVKRANVRKWTSEVVRDVKKGILEVQMHVWDSALDSARQIYTTNDLSSLSTRDLQEASPITDDLIELRLVCVRKALDGKGSRILPTERQTSASTLGTDSDLNSAHKALNPSVNMSARHMSLAHMSAGNLLSLSSGLERTDLSAKDLRKKGSTSARDLKDRSFFRNKSRQKVASEVNLSGLSGQKNASWSLPQKTKKSKKRTQLFSSQLNDSLLMMRKSVRKSLSDLEDDFRNSEWVGGMGSSGSLSSNDIDIEKKKQRFLRLSNKPGEAVQKKPSRRNPPRRSSDSLLGQLVDLEATQTVPPRFSDTVHASAFSRADQAKKFWKLCQSKMIFETKEEEETGITYAQENKDDPAKSPSSAPPRFRTSERKPPHNMPDGKEDQSRDSSEKRVNSETDRLKRFLSRSSEDFVPPEQSKAPKQTKSDTPPLMEISVVTNGPTNQPIPLAPPAPPPGISLSPDVVKEVFPYHVVLDSDFRILQVGNSLPHLFRSFDETEPPFNFIGRIVSDVFMCTGPVPMYGKWDWSVLDKLRDKILYFESVLTNSTRNKANLKGTIIEVSESPRQIMLSLLPNVKNLTELSNMDLSMGDLPIHSCQRDAVLLGEHSASEVKLTNHLDKLHRGLIDSMEQQIKDRTVELAMANESLEEANKQIQQQSARQLEHFACMSHEIRTPLNCIVGMSSILLEETHAEVDPPHAESIQMIYTSAELLRAVVDDVLDYAKLESGSFEVDITRIDLQESVAGVVHSISQKIQEKNIRLRCHFSPDLPRHTETDSRRLQQVLFNLLGNAGKFSKRNSVIDLSVELISRNHKGGIKRDCRDSAIVDLETCDLLRFSVKDYGKGIEKKDFETIFQPFSQASKQTATVYGGTGLGLSITSNLVKRLGGRISLDSEAGKFTEFVVELPFDGVAVDEKAIQQQMKDVLIVLVQPKETYDYSFTSYPIAAEPSPFGKQVMDYFGSRAVSVANVGQLLEQSSQLKTSNPDCHFALLVNEDLYDDQLLKQVEGDLGDHGCTIMTFGPKYDVDSTKNAHVKSIRGVFPFILLDFISQNVSKTKQKSSKLTANKSSSRAGIPVQSGDKKNNTVAVTKNKSQATRNAAKKQEEKYNANGQSLKVLYAEDNKINQKVLTRVLNRVGIMDVSIVDDGLKAVNISETTAFDIIFMDMQMPVMDGIEACNLIIERDKDAKVVFVTAHALDEFKHKAKAAGGAGFISKPFRVEDIKQILRQFDFE